MLFEVSQVNPEDHFQRRHRLEGSDRQRRLGAGAVDPRGLLKKGRPAASADCRDAGRGRADAKQPRRGGRNRRAHHQAARGLWHGLRAHRRRAPPRPAARLGRPRAARAQLP